MSDRKNSQQLHDLLGCSTFLAIGEKQCFIERLFGLNNGTSTFFQLNILRKVDTQQQQVY